MGSLPMILCPSCASEVPDGYRFCASCARPLSSSSQSPTEMAPSARGASLPLGRLSSSGLDRESRFLPGAILAARYRIVGLLGKGGMGEVYRADDLKLGQAVALKFLPEGLEGEGERLARFLGEVRTARQVSHPNVCRVYDVGELEGHHFLTMEFVDGEDLASLLRRIGRLPGDKAVQLARQISAGLAAAHDAGVLHRDLKPSNVMVDGRGNARITDFGLAGLAGEIEPEEVRYGTPAYMAPEQLAGREVTARSDIYALGLVLYELFTGEAPFRATSAGELLRLQTETTPASPATLIEGLDPAVERVILRCLERDPAARPPSALAVAAALPGGDPIAAALAAGETPSPEMVAGASEGGRPSPAIAWVALAGFLAGVVALVALAGRATLSGLTPLDKPPEVLAERARAILAKMGHDEPPADWARGFLANDDYLDHLERQDPPPRDWEVLRRQQPAAMWFWYRQSPRPLVRIHQASIGDWLQDPPPTLPGMAEVILDPRGRLVSLEIVPPDREAAGGPGAGVGWAPLFAAAGIDRAAFREVPSTWTPPVYADQRIAWEGAYPEAPEVEIRVEAAAYDGRPVAFRIVEPWTRPAAAAPEPRGLLVTVSDLVGSFWFVVVVFGAGLLAWRNVRMGRGDQKTAVRFALYLGAVRLLWFPGLHHTATTAEVFLLQAHLAFSFYRVGLAWIFYLALEPYARRLWPRMLVSWVRLFDGRWRDPQVGRDLLAGSLYGVLVALTIRLAQWLPGVLGGRASQPETGIWPLEALRGARHAFAALAGVHVSSVLFFFIGLMMLLVLRVVLRKGWIAVPVFCLLAPFVFYPGTGSITAWLVGIAVILGLFFLALFRFGLLAVAVGSTVDNLLRQMPLTFDLTSWFAPPGLFAMLLCAAGACYGFYRALGGRPLLRDELLEAEAGAR